MTTLKDLLPEFKNSGVKIYNKRESVCPCCGNNNATEAMSSGIFNTDMRNTCIACGSEYIDRVKEILLERMTFTAKGRPIRTYPEGVVEYKRNAKQLCPYCGEDKLHFQVGSGEEDCIKHDYHYLGMRCRSCNLSHLNYLTYVFEGQEVIKDKTKEDINE